MPLTLPRSRAGLGALVVLLLVGCLSDSDLGRFDQTWETALEDTTCIEWLDELVVQERFAAAADLLLSIREATPGFPSDGQFTFFMSRITLACEDAPQAMLPQVAGDVYSTYETQLSQ